MAGTRIEMTFGRAEGHRRAPWPSPLHWPGRPRRDCSASPSSRKRLEPDDSLAAIAADFEGEGVGGQMDSLRTQTTFEGKSNVVASFGGDLDLACLLVPANQARLLQDGGQCVAVIQKTAVCGLGELPRQPFNLVRPLIRCVQVPLQGITPGDRPFQQVCQALDMLFLSQPDVRFGRGEVTGLIERCLDV